MYRKRERERERENKISNRDEITHFEASWTTTTNVFANSKWTSDLGTIGRFTWKACQLDASEKPKTQWDGRSFVHL